MLTSGLKVNIPSQEAMILLGRKLAPQLVGKVVCFDGDLGVGKTTLIKGIIAELTNLPVETITSPTFNIMSQYGNYLHFDCYRLNTPQEFIEAGLLDELESDKTALIEWPERIASLLPKEAISIHLSHTCDSNREVTIAQY